MIPAPNYKFCRDLIAHLRTCPDLRDLVMPDVFDAESQCDQVAVSAEAYDTCITVSAGYPHNPHAEGQQVTRLVCPVLISVMTVPNMMLAPDVATTDEHVANIIATLCAHLRLWTPQRSGIPYTRPDVVGVIGLDLTKMPKISNLTGQGLMLHVSLNY